ncbi:unnamed protein product [Meganyctiphanes norvegica]|uniref:Uncharacterized protein n=1 Tax=Meganyctiphanes norvegica TaxID=48144 RepID=A0AAV2QD21_MEGNR
MKLLGFRPIMSPRSTINNIRHRRVNTKLTSSSLSTDILSSSLISSVSSGTTLSIKLFSGISICLSSLLLINDMWSPAICLSQPSYFGSTGAVETNWALEPLP